MFRDGRDGRDFTVERGGSRIVFARGGMSRVGAELERMGASRALVVSTPGRSREAGDLLGRLGARGAGVAAIAKEHVPADVVKRGQDELARAKADVVVAFGGGSAIGLAKALARGGNVRIVAIPTTFSGSEMTPVYGVTENGSEGPRKNTGRDERVRPALVVYDPDLFRELPLSIAIPSLWNAIAHAVEALWVAGSDRAMRAGAEAALHLALSAVSRLGVGADDTSARDDAVEAAYLAGVAFADAGPGLHHKLCHVLGGSLGLPHAQTHAVVLPHVVAFHREAAPEALAAIGRAIGTVDPERALARLSRATAVRAGVATSLSALGMKQEQIAGVVAAMMASPALHPRPLDEASLTDLVTKAWTPTTDGAGAAGLSLRAPATLSFVSGFGGFHESEALPGALPKRQNVPRHAPYGLYPELYNGTPFTTRRAENLRTWSYRIRPSSSHGPFRPLPASRFAAPLLDAPPERMRWRPMPFPSASTRVDFLDGLVTLGASGEATGAPGFAVHLYAANADMIDRSFSTADGDLLIVLQEGALDVRTELGWLRATPGTVVLVPRGIKFAVGLPDARSRGWMLETHGVSLRLPERGPLGSNGLADARHFLAPTASYEDRACANGFQLVTKLGGKLYAAEQSHSPFDVVAWHGNHVPRSYDLRLFNPMGTVSFDHPDPSIHTVLTAALDDHGRAACDFVAFVGRWEVAEHTFRPPSLHRNAATEINAVLSDPRPDSGYDPGCIFLTPMLTAHGITTAGYDAVLALPDAKADEPHRISDESIWIMFESALPFRTTAWASETPLVDRGFLRLFENLGSRFDPDKP